MRLRLAKGYVINNRLYEVDQYSYIITNSGENIKARLDSKTSVEGICIGFSKYYMTGLMASVKQSLSQGMDNPFEARSGNRFITIQKRLSNDTLSNSIKVIKNHVMNNNLDYYNEEEFYLSLAELLINLQLDIYSQVNKLQYVKLSTREEIYHRVTVMNDYIEANYKTDITIDQLSQLSCLSKYHAIRSYQKIFGITPYQKIQALRLSEAKQLILKLITPPKKDNNTQITQTKTLKKLARHYYKQG